MNGGEIIAIVAIASSALIFIVIAALTHHRRVLDLQAKQVKNSVHEGDSLRAEVAALRDTVASLTFVVERQSDVIIDRAGLHAPAEVPPPFGGQLKH